MSAFVFNVFIYLYFSFSRLFTSLCFSGVFCLVYSYLFVSILYLPFCLSVYCPVYGQFVLDVVQLISYIFSKILWSLGGGGGKITKNRILFGYKCLAVASMTAGGKYASRREGGMIEKPNIYTPACCWSEASEEMERTIENYKILVTKETPDEKVIFRDIHRTFPAHEFFKVNLSFWL